MAVARAELIPTSPNPLWFNLATEWIMKDLQNRLDYPLEAGVRKEQERVSAENKRLHEAARKLELTLIPLAIAALAIVGWINKDQIISALDLSKANQAPNPANVIGVPESTLAALEDLKTPTLRPTETLTPTLLPTFTLALTETPTPTATATEKPPTRTLQPTKEYVAPPPSPTPTPEADPFAGWIPNPNGSGQLLSPYSSEIDAACFNPKYPFVGITNFSSAPDAEVEAINIHNPPDKFKYRCTFYNDTVALRVSDK